jgi:hypothetical protein
MSPVILGPRSASNRVLRISRPSFLFAAALLAEVTAGAADDLVLVPGGAASVRRLLRLEKDRPAASFFREVNEVLLFEGEAQASWTQVEGRKAVVEFVEDLADWRKEFGRVVTFGASSKAEVTQARRALAWLGIEVAGEPAGWTTETRTDSQSLRRRKFLDAIGIPMPLFLSRLRAGQPVVVAPRDEAVPLPLGLAAWQEILAEPKLTGDDAFLHFVQNVRPSRMLVTVQALDVGTLDGLAALGGKKGIAAPLSVLYERALDSFAHYPEAISLSDGRFDLPGGREADPIWKDVFGVSPSAPARFLRALYETDSGKGAYVVDALQQLPEAISHAVVLGRTGGGPKSVARFRRIYRSIEKSAVGFELARRDPYDFAHIARFLRLTDEGELGLQGANLDGDGFPLVEAELARIVSEAKPPPAPEEVLSRIFRADTGRSVTSPRRRFLFVSNLIERRPDLEEPGLVGLLLRGADRFFPAYAVLEDVPADVALAHRYLFTLDRLDRRRDSRSSEVACGLFQGAAELLAHLVRSGGLDPSESRELFSSLVGQPLFAEENAVPADAPNAFFSWVSDRFLATLRKRVAAGGEDATADDVLARALVGPARPFPFDWRGGRYAYDATTDELARRAAFRERQRLASLQEVEAILRARGDLLAAAGKRDLEAARHAVVALAEGLRVSDPAEGEESDRRIVEEEGRARVSLAEAEKVSAGAPPQLASRIDPVDALIAERMFEAILGHVYSISAGDPDDLYYQDPDFVRHHSFQAVEKGGRVLVSPFGPTMLSPRESGGGFRINGSVFGLPDILGLLHAEQMSYNPGAFIGNEQIRSGLVGPVRRMSPARVEDDALTFVAASCRATEQLAAALGGQDPRERLRAWRDVARDLVPRSRLARVAELGREAVSREALAEHLSPSDLYRIGRRLALAPPSSPPPAGDAAGEARDAFARLQAKFGERGAGDRLAEFGPRTVAYAGRMRLSDLDLPPYERLASYRTPQLFSDRLYDLKVAVARVVSENGLPAALLPLVLPGAVDKMMADVRMAFAYDWRSIVRKANAFGLPDLEFHLDEALKSGRLVRDESAEPPGEGP